MSAELLDVSDEQLLRGLQQDVTQASYVVGREMQTFQPSTAATYSPSGAKVMEIPLNVDFLDTSTMIQLQFTLRNTAGTFRKLIPIGPPHVFFARYRVTVGGVVIDDQPTNFARYMQQLAMFQSSSTEMQQEITNGYLAMQPRLPAAGEPMPRRDSLGPAEGIEAGGTRVCNMVLPGCLFTSGRIVPLRAMGGAVVTLEIVSAATDAVVTAGANNISEAWEIEQPVIKAQSLTLETSAMERINGMVARGETIFALSNYVLLSQSVPSSDYRASFLRSLGRLKGVVISQHKDAGSVKTVNIKFLDNTGADTNANFPLNAVAKKSTYFYVDSSADNQFQLQIGGKLFPSQPTGKKAYSELFRLLLQFVGLHGQRDSIMISPEAYSNISTDSLERHTSKFCVGLDTEKYGGEVALSGVDTRNQSITVNATGTGLAGGDEVFIMLHYDVDLKTQGLGSLTVSE